MKPHVERTEFVLHSPPATITLWFCPACGRQITGIYNIDPAKKQCTKTWHLDMPVEARYVRRESLSRSEAIHKRKTAWND